MDLDNTVITLMLCIRRTCVLTIFFMLVQKLGINLMFGQKLRKFFVRQMGRQVETVWFISHLSLSIPVTVYSS